VAGASVTSTDLGQLGGDMGSATGTGPGTGGQVGGDMGGYGGADNGYADGGSPEGVADNIDISVSEGEYIVSADVVEKLGEDFFNQLQAAFHTPAAATA